ncbi:MAG: hypothetical protein LBQ22_05940 [Bacteroidales bacterium]|jgi:uncharacterized membrane protein|nr:hypothetical protein [Bacteroidales bacterium]
MEMREVQISYVDALKTSFTWGLKNLPSILGAVVLYVLTCWVPYINIGTTIALVTLPIELSKGKVVSPTFIFDGKYRKYMGEMFLLWGLKFQGVFLGTLFFIIPGIVISFSWLLGSFLVIDKGLNPLEALTKSNQYTNGNKKSIFLTYLIIAIGLGLVTFILGLIPAVGGVLSFLVIIACSPMFISMEAYFYKKLVLDRENTPIE